MMVFKEMDQEVIRKALEGHKDVLTPAMEEHTKYFKNLFCINCGEDVHPVIDPRMGLFRPHSVLPNYMAKCNKCGCEFEPYTKIQVNIPR